MTALEDVAIHLRDVAAYVLEREVEETEARTALQGRHAPRGPLPWFMHGCAVMYGNGLFLCHLLLLIEPDHLDGLPLGLVQLVSV